MQGLFSCGRFKGRVDCAEEASFSIDCELTTADGVMIVAIGNSLHTEPEGSYALNDVRRHRVFMQKLLFTLLCYLVPPACHLWSS